MVSLSRTARAAAGALASLVVLAACSSSSISVAPVESPAVPDAPPAAGEEAGTGTASEPAPDPEPELSEWRRCGASAECAQLTVPVDHDDPSGPTLGLDVIRRPATGDDRIGILLLNPGGPGASGVDFLARSDAVPDDVAERFDQVSFDPRGLRGTRPLDCTDELLDFYLVDPTPDDQAEAAELREAALVAAQACARNAGDLLPHFTTEAAARDMDVLRAALGEEQISYLGFSYGTLLGQYYAELFPERVRAMVLDGVVDPELGLRGLLTEQARALDALLERLFATCAGFSPCPVDDSAAVLAELMAAAEAGNGVTTDEGPLEPAALADAVVFASYDPATYGTLIDSLADAARGDGRLIGILGEAYRDFDGWAVYTAVSCVDSPVPNEADFTAFAAELEAEVPTLGGAVANELLPCAFWDAGTDRPPAPITAAGTPTILVVGNTGDVATPYESAVEVDEQLADSVLLTLDGEGHTSLGRSSCIDDAVTAYLVDLETEPGLVCQ